MLIKTYLDEQKKLNINNASFIDTLIQSAHWESLASGDINNASHLEMLVYIPVNYNKNTTGLAFIIRKASNKVEEGYLAEIKSKSAISDPLKTLANFYGYKNTELTGSISRYEFGNTFKWEMGYENGVNTYQKGIRHSNYPPASLHLSSEEANNIKMWVGVSSPTTTYYMVTYYVDGSEDWKYLTGPCSSNCKVNQQITSKSTNNISIDCGGTNVEQEMRSVYKSNP
jgi:hypothetical protein